MTAMTTVRTQTILNNPVFLNPQAYYVFPQLYNIAGSSESISHSVEKAVYSGRLSVIVDSGSIDYQINADSIEFTANGDCVFTIILNTDEGSCVLGRWNIYHTATLEIVPIARYSARGRTNRDANRTTLPDLTGNGHDLTLKNFIYGRMSGFGGFVFDFRDWTITDKLYTGSYTDSKWVGNGNSGEGSAFLFSNDGFANQSSFKIRVSGLVPNTHIDYRNFIDNRMIVIGIYTNGEYIIPAATGNTSYKEFGFLGYGFNNNGNPIVTIEQIPLYPDGLVFDGIDDYCINNTIVNTVGTVIIKYKNIPSDPSVTLPGYVFDFSLPRKYLSNMAHGVGSNGKINQAYTSKDIFVVSFPNNTEENHSSFLLGSRFNIAEYNAMIMYDMSVYDKILTTEEIELEIEKWFSPTHLPIQPLARYSTKHMSNAGITPNILKDLTGNGHDLPLSTFTFDKNGGYINYAPNFTDTPWYTARGQYKVSPNGFIVPAGTLDLLQRPANEEVPRFAIHVSGLTKSGVALYYVFIPEGGGEGQVFEMVNDGAYVMPYSHISKTGALIGFSATTIPLTEITVDLIKDTSLFFDSVRQPSEADSYINPYALNDTLPALIDATIIMKFYRSGDFVSTQNNTYVFSQGPIPYKYDRYGVENLSIKDVYSGFDGNVIREKSFVTCKGTNTYITDVIDYYKPVFYCSTKSYDGIINITPPDDPSIVPPEISEQYPQLFYGQKDARGFGINISKGRYYAEPQEDIRIGNVSFLKGLLQDLIIYDRVLTDEEVKNEIKKYNL